MQTNKLMTYSSQIQKMFWNLLSSVIDEMAKHLPIMHGSANALPNTL